MSVGPFALFDYVSFAGSDTTDDLSGDVLEPDDLTILRLVAGGHVRILFGRLIFFGLQVGVGLASVGAVDATQDSGGTSTDVELYDQTDTLAFELSVRLGAKFDVGKNLGIGAYLFLGISVAGAPEKASEAGAVQNLDVDSDDIGIGYGGLAISIEFGG